MDEVTKDIALSLTLASALTLMPAVSSAQSGVDADADAGSETVNSLSERPVERLSLRELDEYAEEHAPRIREAREELGFADARMEGAKIVLPSNPRLEAGIANKFLDGYGLRKFEVGLSQAVEIAGERGARMRAADAYGERLEAELETVRWEVHRDVHVLYQRTKLAERRLELARQVRELADTLRGTTERRQKAGEVGRTEVEVAGAEAARARASVVRARQRLEEHALQLAEVVGWQKESMPLAKGALPEVREAPEVGELVERAMEYEPSLKAIEARREAADARLEVAKREVWPNPTFGVAYEEEQRLGPDLERSLWFRVAVPLPTWRRNQEQKATARVEESVARTRLANRRRVLKTRIRRRVVRLNKAAERVAIFGEDVLPRFDEQLRLLQRGFELGEMSILDVYNARDRLLEVQRKALDARETYLEARGDLERSLGTEIWSTAEAK